MDAQQCTSCIRYWASNSGPRGNFDIVTRVCPDCIARSLPIVDRVQLRDEPAYPSAVPA